MINIDDLEKKAPVVEALRQTLEVAWINPLLETTEEALKKIELTIGDVRDAKERLERFAPFIRLAFPETEKDGGLIESPVREISRMKEEMNGRQAAGLRGRLLLKMDSDLAVAGSVKARGGIYEILKYAEELAIREGILKEGQSYEAFARESFREFFSRYAVHVGSTGNLGLSIGIISAALGFRVYVHMSQDAKQWKKDLLRSKGVRVIEYEGDYGAAVKKGREEALRDPRGYFVDDENSVSLFLGYAVSALRLRGQLEALGVKVDREHPLFVYVPCGVGGAPGGITFGLKLVYGDYVHVFYAEPVQACCMILGIATGLHNEICVQDIGLNGMTEADGLAVGRPSKFVGKIVEHLLSGEMTVQDDRLYVYMKELLDREGIFIEPSSCAAFAGPARMEKEESCRAYLKDKGLEERMEHVAHLVWATGGSLVPVDVRAEYVKKAEETERRMRPLNEE